MKVMLVQPDMVFKKHHPLVFKGFAATIPLGIAYIAAYLQRQGHSIRIIDYQISNYDIAQEIKSFQPDILGISICSPAVPHSNELARIARKASPKLVIIAGGPHVSAYRDLVLKSCPAIDLLVVGEGELTMVNLVKSFSCGESIEGVKGIVFRKDKELISTGEGPMIENLSELPMMPLHLFDIKKYYPLPGTFRRLPSVAFSTTRGCPFKCTFCNSKTIWKDKVRLRPPLSVVDEIEFIVNKYGAKEIYFVDELFTLKRDNVAVFCEELLLRKINIGWKCCARVDSVDRQLLHLMKRSGCFMISYGVESGDERILKIMNKGITIEQAKETFKLTKEAGILRMAFFILNSYGETRDSVQKTLSLCKEIAPDFLNFELFKPFPGVEMRRQIESDPLCKINRDIWDDWNEFTVGNQIFYTQSDLSAEYLKTVYEKSIKGFYLKPDFILKRLVNIRSYEQFKSYFKTFLNMLTVEALNK